MKANDFKFRRQHPISPYVVDFVCLKSRLIIEIDGPSHDARQHIDRSRDIYLQHMGYTILRFSNDDIYDNSEGVILQILHTAKGLSDEPYAPLP
jgi:very-short-patch-repair endonuclease